VFVPVHSLEQIPEGLAFERVVLEMKGGPKAYQVTREGTATWDTFEMAKDVASFANTIGGAIVLGAVQRKGELVLARHCPVDEKELADFMAVLRSALDKRCSPPPFIDPVRLPLGHGALLALNVWPFPGQPVAVSISARAEDGFGGNAYVFPVRVADGTEYLRPEHLPMFMSPEVRRRAIVLRQIKPDTEIWMHPIHRPHEHMPAPFRATLRVLDEQNNRVDFHLPQPTGSLSLPIDQLRSVWLAADGVHILLDILQYVGFQTVQSYART